MWTPLLFAASRSSNEEARVLIEAGADVNHAEKDGWTPIFFAAYQNNVELCNFLLGHSANLLHVAVNGLTSYGAASLNGYTETAIQLANIALVEALIVSNGQRILEIVADGADPDTCTSTGWTPLIFMVTRHDLEGVSKLIEAGADVNKAENDGWTPLMMAAEFGHTEMVKYLLDAGADVFMQTYTGRTALACAEAGKFTAVINLLHKAIASRMKTIKNPKRSRDLNLSLRG